MSISHEEALLNALIVKLVLTWTVFRRSHDVEAQMKECCEHTAQLYGALDELEHLVMNDEAHKPLRA